MRKFSTSLFIALLALLALPERAWAWTSVEFRASLYEWAEGYTMTKNSESSFTYEFAASKNFEFKFHVSDNDLWFGSYDTNYQTVSNYDGTVTYWCSNSGGDNITFKVDSRYTKYRIDLLWNNQDGDNHYFKYTVTGITEGGSEDTYNLVYLVDKALNGQQLHTWLEGGATDEGITDWNSRPTIGSGDFATTTTYNDTEYYTKTFSVNKTTADNYKQIGAKIGGGDDLTSTQITSSWDNVQYIIVTSSGVNIVENTATMYTVTVSSADANMGTVSATSVSVNATTSQPVTAYPNTGYEFVNWTASDGVTVADESSPETTVTATQAGTLTANFKVKSTDPDPTPTPKPIPGFYLVGNFLQTDNGINYNCRYFKLSEIAAATAARDGEEEYSINIPTTLAVNVQVLAINENGTTALYGPSGTLAINKTNPAGSGTITGDLVEADKTLTNYFKFENRTENRTTKDPDANDGLYTITVTVTNGVPTNYTIKHNPLTRVAYYLPNTPDASVKESLNSRSGETAAFNNVFFGRVYLPAGVACYVLSNYLREYDNNKKTDTKTKLYLQGNKTGENPNTTGANRDDYTKVYPITDDNGTATGAKPFVFSKTDIVAMDLEYDPTKGHGNYQAEGIFGEVLPSSQKAQVGGSAIDVPTIKVLKMVGPAVGDETWDYSQGVVMNYNMAEQCWEATINTTAAAGAKFRFVANDTWENSWQENGTDYDDKARMPYDGNGKGHAATPADPNEVSYISLTQNQVRDENYDIIFNRDPGKWRVRFYFTSKQIGTGNSYTYVFKYTINGYESVVRTYCSNENQIPTDKSIKIYGAYAFKGDEATKSGTIKLYEMNYIPAKEGVILYSTNAIEGWNFEHYTRPEGETMYKNIPDNNYINYLKGTLENTTVDASVFNGNNERTHRNFFFNYLKNTGYYKEGDTDYLGFFRIKSGSPCEANHAYLSLPTSVLTWNGQTFEQVMESGVQAELTKGMRIVFSDGSDWEENTTTAISVVKQAKPADNAYYTLQGVRVAAPAKGIYIHNGKKIIIR